MVSVREGDSLQSGKKYIGFKCNGEESDYSALCDAYSSIDAGESFTALKEGGKVVLDFGFSSEIFDGGSLKSEGRVTYLFSSSLTALISAGSF